MNNNPTPTTPAAAAREQAYDKAIDVVRILVGDETQIDVDGEYGLMVKAIAAALLSERQAALTEAADVARSKKVHLTFEQLIRSDTDYCEYNYGIDQVIAALDAPPLSAPRPPR